MEEKTGGVRRKLLTGKRRWRKGVRPKFVTGNGRYGREKRS
jgi:hypothetical protein